MKRKHILLTLIPVVLAGGIVLTACTAKKRVPSEASDQQPEISYYTCPMHPQIRRDHPGNCPICGMALVPVYKGGNHDHGPETSPSSGGPTLDISPERQQLIGVRTVVAKRQEAVQEIRTVGRVAFDPGLAVAQREYIDIARNVPSLKEAATARLRLLGMAPEEIRALDGRNNAGLYLPGAKDSLWIYATLYQDEADLVRPGSKARISSPSGNESAPLEGIVRSIDPVVDPMSRTLRARIEVPKAGSRFRPDAYVNVSLRSDLGRAILVPKSALIDTGKRKIVFVVQEGRRFQARNVETGPEAGDDVVILKGLEEGESVVTGATFLVDSESQLKAAVIGLEGHP